MNRDKKEPEYPVELESQFIMRLPEEPAKALRDSLRSEETLRNRLTIQLEDDMRHGQVRFDHWLLHAKIVDLPTIIESLKTIDRKSLYKTADICQMMICKEEAEPSCIEEESLTKNKKKDPFKVDKKFLFSHGITPPTKNVRKRRFRKTLKKKSAEAPEIEKEVKRLLRADNEAVSVTWEIIKEDEEIKPETSNTKKSEKNKIKKDQKAKMESSKVEDIFGEAVSDSDIEENINVEVERLNRLSTYDDHMSDSNSIQGTVDYKSPGYLTQFRSEMFQNQIAKNNFAQASTSHDKMSLITTDLDISVNNYLQQKCNISEDINLKLQKVRTELEELKQKKQHTQQEISGMANMTLKQRFQNILETLNKEIHFKEKECKKLQYSLKKN